MNTRCGSGFAALSLYLIVLYKHNFSGRDELFYEDILDLCYWTMTNRHKFQSFKDRINDIKIDPHSKIGTRSHDYASSSFFITTIDHWREINVSANFVECLDYLEPLSGSLPSIIHNSNKIFDVLELYIRRSDHYSLQPLLEALTQFIHDLGPDFMCFYPRYLKIIIHVSTFINLNTTLPANKCATAYEWCFNSLAHAFRYLSLVLTQNLWTTFEELLPLLKNQKQLHVGRYCAEAFSYLIRKLTSQAYINFIEQLSDRLISLEMGDVFCDNLILLFSEAMKMPNKSLHTRSLLMLAPLLEKVLQMESKNKTLLQIVSRVLYEVTHQASNESGLKFTEKVFAELNKYSTIVSTHEHSFRLFYLTLVILFVDNGKKVVWNKETLRFVNEICSAFIRLDFEGVDIPESASGFALFLAVVSRNMDALVSSNLIFKIWEAMPTNYSEVLKVSILNILMDCSNARMRTLCLEKLLQQTVNGLKLDAGLKRLLLIFLRKHDSDSDLLKCVTLPKPTKRSLIKSLSEDSKVSNDIEKLAWKCEILDLTARFDSGDLERICDVLDTVLSRHNVSEAADLIGHLINLYYKCLANPTEEKCRFNMVDFINKTVLVCKESVVYINSLRQFVGSKAYISADVITFCIRNLSSSHKELRLASTEILMISCPENEPLLSQFMLIDQISLDVSNANNIRARVSEVFRQFAAMKTLTVMIQVLSHYVIGLLSNKFQPCWQAVHEGLKSITNTRFDEFMGALLLKQAHRTPQTQNGNRNECDTENVSHFSSFLRLDEHLFEDYAYRVCNLLPQNTEQLTMWLRRERQMNKKQDLFSVVIRSRLLYCLSVVPRLVKSQTEEVIELTFSMFANDSNEEWTSEDKVTILNIVSSLRLRNHADALKRIIMSTLSSKNKNLQEVALKTLFALDCLPEKYRDNLFNLLDERLFKEELMNLVGDNSSGRVHEADENVVFPVIVQILFGKIQFSGRKHARTGAKFTVATLLPNLPRRFIKMFLSQMSNRIPWQTFFLSRERKTTIFKNTKTMAGFINMLAEVYDSLGYKYKDLVAETSFPLVYVLICTQELIDSSDEETTGVNLKGLRQNAFKCLTTLDKIAGTDLNWKDLMPALYEFVLQPRMENFAAEHTEQTSSLLDFILSRVEMTNYLSFFKLDDWLPLRAVLSLLVNKNCKDDVVISILDSFISVFTKQGLMTDESVQYFAIMIEGLFNCLPQFLQDSRNKDILSRCATLLLLIVQGNFLKRDDDKLRFMSASCNALKKSSFYIKPLDKVSILLSLSIIVRSVDCEISEFSQPIWTCSTTLRFSNDNGLRNAVTTFIDSLSSKFGELASSAKILSLLNGRASYNSDTYNFDMILDGFDGLNEDFFRSNPYDFWCLFVANSLFYMDNKDESILRLNASAAIKNLVTYVSKIDSPQAKEKFKENFDYFINPAIRHGLANHNDDVRNAYLDLLGNLSLFSELLPNLNDLKCLRSENEELDFFVNMQHLQITARQRAVRDLIGRRHELSPSSVEYYIIPLLENYLLCTDEKSRNLTEDAHKTFGSLACVLPWPTFNAFLRKYINICSSNADHIKDASKVVLQLISNGSAYFEHDNSCASILSESDLDRNMLNTVIHPLKKVLSKRDDSTIIMRLPLLEACVLALLRLTNDIVKSELPSVLIGTCQVLRSKSQELRDGARKALCKAASHLGATFLPYIIRELKAALSRGSQIHVLSFTLHELLRELISNVKHGELDLCASEVINIIMEDIFGASGKEKDADGYVSKMREVKAKKSYDSMELLCSKLDLSEFDTVLNPIKTLLKQSLPLKTERMLDELLRRISQGLLKNEAANSKEMLILCYAIHVSSIQGSDEEGIRKTFQKDESHFLVNLDSAPPTIDNDHAQYTHHVQRIALELLRTITGKHKKLLSPQNMDGFIPLLSRNINSANEALTVVSMKVATTIVKLNFDAQRDTFFKEVFSMAVEFVMESPSTKAELSQVSLRYIATALRHKGCCFCTDNAVRALITKITPDLENPENQSAAFDLVRAILARRIDLAEVYDLMDRILSIMVVNHFQEIRDIARRLYFKFLLLYNQGEKRLELCFKFMIENLAYPTISGRQSVMELIHSIVLKSSSSIVDAYASSFFVGLAKVTVIDELTKCREMASALIKALFSKTSQSKHEVLRSLVISWLHNSRKDLLRRCGLVTYKIYLEQYGLEQCQSLNIAASQVIEEYLSSSISDESENSQWENIYIALDVLEFIYINHNKTPWKESLEFWNRISDCLLYPHSWVRHSSSKLFYCLLSRGAKTMEYKEPKFLQNVCYRLLRQLAAPNITEALSKLSVRNIQMIYNFCEKNAYKYCHHISEKEPENEFTFEFQTDMIEYRCLSLLRRNLSQPLKRETRIAALELTIGIAVLMSIEKLRVFAQEYMTTFKGIENADAEDGDAVEELQQRCFKIAEERLGTSEFTKMFTAATSEVSKRRARRKAERAQLLIDNPEKASERRLKKHARFREKRKHNKDDNGFYKAKKRRL